MNPLLFGSRDRQLFGIHSPAAAGGGRRRCAVICPSWGQEYQRGHRACRQLAERLARNGCDVLRFDYYGTGDSAGAGDQVTFDGCVKDAITAVDEARALAGARNVLLVGIRLGAAIALHAAAESRAVDAVALWDPVVKGAGYLNELAAAAHGAGTRSDGTRFVGGYPLSETFEREIAAIDAIGARSGPDRILIVASEERAEYDDLANALRSDADVEYAVHPGPRAWDDEAALGVGAIPVELLDHIVNWERAR